LAPPEWTNLHRITLSPAVAGVLTSKCECGWEAVFVLPEEHMLMLQKVFEHLVVGHLLILPTITCEWH
jgi:hypothetical protein